MSIATKEVNGRPTTNVSDAERIVSGIAGVALTAYAIAQKESAAKALPLGAVGGFLLYRSATGNCPAYTALHTGTSSETTNPDAVIPGGQGVNIAKSMTIQKTPEELYEFWHDFENLPRFMKHLEAVEVIDEKHSRWTAKAPLGQTVSWNAEIIADEPGTLIAWKSEEPADIPNAGSVRFKGLPAGRGTVVTVSLEYNPPAGMVGAAVAKLFGEEPGTQVNDSLRRFKALMEAGEIPTIAGQPQGVIGHSIG